MESNFVKGDCVEWTYKHFLNRKSFTHITKRGKFVRMIGISSGECLVHFRGNKNPSRVKAEEIIKCEHTLKNK